MRRTDTILDKIIAQRREDLEATMRAHPLSEVKAQVADAPPTRSLRAVLDAESSTPRIIAEIKKASPSKGEFVVPGGFDAERIAEEYAEHGAAAISVLTEERFFQGSLEYLRRVRERVQTPVLRKDFMIDPYQYWEARAAGADLVLLIVMALEDGELADALALAGELNLDALVEVHDEWEMERALKATEGSEYTILGINNRNLKDFVTDLAVFPRVAKEALQTPGAPPLVAESGIYTREHIDRLGAEGARGYLIGESLMVAEDIGKALGALLKPQG